MRLDSVVYGCTSADEQVRMYSRTGCGERDHIEWCDETTWMPVVYHAAQLDWRAAAVATASATTLVAMPVCAIPADADGDGVLAVALAPELWWLWAVELSLALAGLTVATVLLPPAPLLLESVGAPTPGRKSVRRRESSALVIETATASRTRTLESFIVSLRCWCAGVRA